ncbi:MAG: hypothetical protein GX977_05965 [Firmicutes bacterium]|nr:hypothetical protein [Bacillota bacterium]
MDGGESYMYQMASAYQAPQRGAGAMLQQNQNEGYMAYERYCMMREMNQMCREMNNRLGMMQNTLEMVYDCTCGRKCRKH